LTEPVIREARADDLPEIARMLADDGLGRGRESGEMSVYRDAFARMQAQPGNVYLVAEIDGRIAGCLQYTLIHGLSRAGASRAQIEGVRVDSDHRGQRIGEAMVRAAIEQARADSCVLVQLTTDKRRGDAHRFYERLGFEASHVGMKLAL
jgi:ribosomal protein S18 acetylase RimI-like enzyme